MCGAQRFNAVAGSFDFLQLGANQAPAFIK